jgi:hypothetical protein
LCQPRVFWVNHGVIGATTGYLGQPRGIWGNHGVFGATTGYLGQPRGIWGNHGIFGQPRGIWGNHGVFGATTGYLGQPRGIWGNHGGFAPTFRCIVAYNLIIICSMNVEIDSCKYLCHIISIPIINQIHEYLAQLCPDADI